MRGCRLCFRRGRRRRRRGSARLRVRRGSRGLRRRLRRGRRGRRRWLGRLCDRRSRRRRGRRLREGGRWRRGLRGWLRRRRGGLRRWRGRLRDHRRPWRRRGRLCAGGGCGCRRLRRLCGRSRRGSVEYRSEIGKQTNDNHRSQRRQYPARDARRALPARRVGVDPRRRGLLRRRGGWSPREKSRDFGRQCGGNDAAGRQKANDLR